LTGAILGHANMQSTAIYAHVQHGPSKRAANRVSKKIADAMAGEIVKKKTRKRAQKNAVSNEELMRLLQERLGDQGQKTDALYSALAKSLATPPDGRSARRRLM